MPQNEKVEKLQTSSSQDELEANTATIDSKIDGTVVFGGEDGSTLTNSDINQSYYPNFAVWVEHGLVTENIAIAPSTNWGISQPDYVFEADYDLPSLRIFDYHKITP